MSKIRSQAAADDCPEELKGAKGDMIAGRVAAPICVAIIYGIYEFIALGTSSENYLYTYAPVLGGIAAMVGFIDVACLP
jgi:hypothetical protein